MVTDSSEDNTIRLVPLIRLLLLYNSDLSEAFVVLLYNIAIINP